MSLSWSLTAAIGLESDSPRVDQFRLIRMRGQAGQLSPDPFTLIHRVWLSTWLPFGRSANHASVCDAGWPAPRCQLGNRLLIYPL